MPTGSSVSDFYASDDSLLDSYKAVMAIDYRSGNARFLMSPRGVYI